MPTLAVDRATAADAVAVESLLDAAAAWQQAGQCSIEGTSVRRFGLELASTVAR